MLVKVEDCADDNVEEDKKRLKERSLPAHHPQVLVSMTDEACERNKLCSLLLTLLHLTEYRNLDKMILVHFNGMKLIKV